MSSGTLGDLAPHSHTMAYIPVLSVPPHACCSEHWAGWGVGVLFRIYFNLSGFLAYRCCDTLSEHWGAGGCFCSEPVLFLTLPSMHMLSTLICQKFVAFKCLTNSNMMSSPILKKEPTNQPNGTVHLQKLIVARSGKKITSF